MKKLYEKIAKTSNIFFYVIAIFIILLAVYNFISAKILNNKYTNFFGYTFFEVISGSMSPNIEINDFIFVDVGKHEYKVNDVVTFESNGSFITHRIIDIKNDVIVTKGDANNTVDNPINKDKIIGKVVKVVPKLGVWLDVVTTPKVVLSILMSIILITLCISYIKGDEDKKLSKKKKEIKMLKTDNTNRLIFELCILFALLLSLAFLLPFTLSRFKTEARSDAIIDVAFYLVNDDFQYKNIKLDDIVPSDDDYTYDFVISNTDGTDRTEVALTYDLEVITTTNLPLMFELLMLNESGEYESIVTSDVIDLDEDSAYFRTIKTSTERFEYTEDMTNSYRLVVKFPKEYKDYNYQGISENIEIRIMSRQLLPGDN